jgi:hypothetical protein
MTGGIGFSRLGKALFNENRKLLNRRTKIGENPYAGGKTNRNKNLNPYLKEIQQWKYSKIRSERQMKLVYLGVAISLMILLYIIL